MAKNPKPRMPTSDEYVLAEAADRNPNYIPTFGEIHQGPPPPPEFTELLDITRDWRFTAGMIMSSFALVISLIAITLAVIEMVR